MQEDADKNEKQEKRKSILFSLIGVLIVILWEYFKWDEAPSCTDSSVRSTFNQLLEQNNIENYKVEKVETVSDEQKSPKYCRAYVRHKNTIVEVGFSVSFKDRGFRTVEYGVYSDELYKLRASEFNIFR
ncbi:MAG: hypothetical protein J6M05_02925 [Cardiobacteriaceae bacterium]|nr:hypothetical protein [Cardiobacteriaceae bacterium]